MGIRKSLYHSDRHITCSRRQINNKHIRLPPPHIRQELFQGPLQPRAAPQDRPFGAGEHANRYKFDPPCFHGHKHAVKISGAPVDAEQFRQRKPVNIGINGCCAVPHCCESRGKVCRNRGFPYPAFPRCHGKNTCFYTAFMERVFPAFFFKLYHQAVKLFFAHGIDLRADTHMRCRIAARHIFNT